MTPFANRVRLTPQPRLPPVNATRANVGSSGREWRHLPDRGQSTLTGGGRSCGRPDAESRLGGYLAKAGKGPQRPQTRHGRTAAHVGQHLPDRGQAATLTGGIHRVGVRLFGHTAATPVHACDTGERGGGVGALASTCWIVAKRPTTRRQRSCGCRALRQRRVATPARAGGARESLLGCRLSFESLSRTSRTILSI